MRPARRVALVVLGLVAALASCPVHAEDARLEALRRAIDERRERVAVYERDARGLLEALEALDQSASLLEADANRARDEARRARATLQGVDVEIAALSQRLDATRRAMGARAVALYKAGEVGAIRLLFSAGDVREFLARVQALRRLLVHDRDLVARQRDEVAALGDARARARTAAASRDAAATRLEARSAELAAERGRKRDLVARVNADRARERAALVELETAARALEAKLESFEPEAEALSVPDAGPPFATLRGRLSPPVDSPVTESFGRVVDARFQTETFRKGVVFGAPFGEPVRAVASGRVRFAGWFRGYGKLVILDHGSSYYSVSGHLDSADVAVGDSVAAGDLIGRVGDTGSLAGPRLHFELRRGGEPLDPDDWFEPDDPR